MIKLIYQTLDDILMEILGIILNIATKKLCMLMEIWSFCSVHYEVLSFCSRRNLIVNSDRATPPPPRPAYSRGL